MERRLKHLEQRIGPTPDPGRLVIISPNAWPDQDRDLWERAEILRDRDLHDNLIQKHSDQRPMHRPGVVNVVVVPAPAAVEEASEEERAAWGERASQRAWRS